MNLCVLSSLTVAGIIMGVSSFSCEHTSREYDSAVKACPIIGEEAHTTDPDDTTDPDYAVDTPAGWGNMQGFVNRFNQACGVNQDPNKDPCAGNDLSQQLNKFQDAAKWLFDVEPGALIATNATSSANGNVISFNVTCSTKDHCSAHVDITAVSCPHHANINLEGCQACMANNNTEWVHFATKVSMTANGPGCADWFSKTDSVVRMLLANYREEGTRNRVAKCQSFIDVAEGASNGEFHSCNSAKKCPWGGQQDRTHKLDDASVGECAQSCIDNPDCKYFTTENRGNKEVKDDGVVVWHPLGLGIRGWCIGCKVAPTEDSTSTFPNSMAYAIGTNQCS